jgi:hypothetical protein
VRATTSLAPGAHEEEHDGEGGAEHPIEDEPVEAAGDAEEGGERHGDAAERQRDGGERQHDREDDHRDADEMRRDVAAVAVVGRVLGEVFLEGLHERAATRASLPVPRS